MKNLNHPIIFYEGNYDEDIIDKFKKINTVISVNDIYHSQKKELQNILYPSAHKLPKLVSNKKNLGNWIYYPWNGTLVHCLKEDEYFILRTNRNRNLITLEEQSKLYSITTAIIGLSVGSNIAINLMQSGMSNNQILIDKDKIETTNLNRLRGSLINVGESKIFSLTKQIYELNPYANLELVESKLNKENIGLVLSKKKDIKIIFEAIDDFEMKIRVRYQARKEMIPVVMITSLGDNILVDIERYDLNPKLKLFNGLIGNLENEILSKRISFDLMKKFSVMLVGKENVPIRALDSVKEIGKTLTGRPQLVSSVLIASSIASYLVRLMIVNQSRISGRFRISLDEIFANDIKNNV